MVNFADLFAWDFDFFTETRRGDRFEILAEEKVVDGVPVGYGIIVAGPPSVSDRALENAAQIVRQMTAGSEQVKERTSGESVAAWVIHTGVRSRLVCLRAPGKAREVRAPCREAGAWGARSGGPPGCECCGCSRRR